LLLQTIIVTIRLNWQLVQSREKVLELFLDFRLFVLSLKGLKKCFKILKKF